MELWKPQLHLNKAFLEPGEDTGVLIRTAADDFLFHVTAEIAIRENFLEKYRIQHSRRRSSVPSGQQRMADRNKCGRIPESARKDEKFLILCTRSEFFQNQLPVHIF